MGKQPETFIQTSLSVVTRSSKIRTYWMPASVLLIGIASIALLLWTDRIRERQRNNSVLVFTIMEAEINFATSHLWLEQALVKEGKKPEDVSEALTDLDHAIALIDVTLKGGKSEHGLISVPLKTRELRDQAELIISMLNRFKKIALMRLQDRGEAGTGSLLDLESHPVFKEVLRQSSKLEDMLMASRKKDREESTRLFLVIISTWVVILTTATARLWRLESKRREAEAALVKTNETLLSQTEELTEHREHLEEKVEKRTAELRASNTLLREEIAVRRHTEETLKEADRQVRLLSSQIMAAEEVERSRISKGLHDGLGQSLNVMKLRIRFIEQRLNADQAEIRKDCEELLAYTSQVIEDVRRLSHDLSPTVLSDLGLTSAVKWLVKDFAKNHGITESMDIAEIDDLFDEKKKIVIFRIIQEVLTNIGKHSQARNVSVTVGRELDRVIFRVDDDGKGFDPAKISSTGGENGIGLASIRERIKMLGGLLNLDSGEGRGTRVTFSVPVENKGV